MARDGYAYANEGLEYIRLGWGWIREFRVSPDTEKVAALDGHLPPAAA